MASKAKNTRKYFELTPGALIHVVQSEYGLHLDACKAAFMAHEFNAHILKFQRKYGTPYDYFYISRRLYDNDPWAEWDACEVVNEKRTWYRVLLLWLNTALPRWGMPFNADAPAAVFDDETERVVTAVLHVGFLTLHETPGMLARLRHGREQLPGYGPARSRIFPMIETHHIAPIDAVAAKVSHGSETQRR